MEHTVERQLGELGALGTARPGVSRLLAGKIQANIEYLRAQNTPRATLLGFEGRLMDLEAALHRAQKEAKQLAQPKAEDKEALSELNAVPSTLRKRSKLEVNQEIHDDLSEDLVAMVQQIRRNAQLFNEKLETDKSVVDSAASALLGASSNMTSVGSRLNRYRKSTALGWMFYVYSVAFIVGTLIVGMLLIQLFPKF